MSASEFNITERWPELFEGLGHKEHCGVINALAANWYEGWEPNREDVTNLTDLARGDIDFDEYKHRSLLASQARRMQ